MDRAEVMAALARALPVPNPVCMRGTIRKLGLEGGLWALITDDGQTIELLDPPEQLRKNGQRFEIEGKRSSAEVSIGMVGDLVEVTSFRALND